MDVTHVPEDKKTIIVPEIIALYKNVFGTITADMYNRAYAKEDLKTVLVSFQELMIEFAGEKKGKELVNNLFTKFAITS